LHSKGGKILENSKEIFFNRLNRKKGMSRCFETQKYFELGELLTYCSLKKGEKFFLLFCRLNSEKPSL
jgi:hypothetical protein